MIELRDPRKDPREGDLLRGAKGFRVRVLPCSVPGAVFFEFAGRPHQTDRQGWSEWCQLTKAEVISKGGGSQRSIP
jgi:hypothetical protein